MQYPSEKKYIARSSRFRFIKVPYRALRFLRNNRPPENPFRARTARKRRKTTDESDVRNVQTSISFSERYDRETSALVFFVRSDARERDLRETKML